MMNRNDMLIILAALLAAFGLWLLNRASQQPKSIRVPGTGNEVFPASDRQRRDNERYWNMEAKRGGFK